MDVIHSVADLRERLEREPNNVFVPTMGNLHEGHIQLIDIAKPRAACTVVSIFVNRLQFGPRARSRLWRVRASCWSHPPGRCRRCCATGGPATSISVI